MSANAVIRKRALDDIVETSYIGDWEIRHYIRDRTVIEDTESTIDMGLHGWRLYNCPERMSYSATPPDFGSLSIQRRRVDVLPGHTADVVEEWLRDHAGVEIVCRDGSGAYGEAVRRALTGAVQVSDRWHLWHGLAEAVRKDVAAHCACWAGAAQCTTAKEGRTITIGPHEARLAAARQAQADPAWRPVYRAIRPKVERKIGHLMRRRHGGRRARVRGLVKVAADFALLAAAVNLARLGMLGVAYRTATAPGRSAADNREWPARPGLTGPASAFQPPARRHQARAGSDQTAIRSGPA